MPRHPDPELEDNILQAAEALWRRGGEQALTMRAVAQAARTNTPAVYRRFKNREDLVRGLLLRIAGQIRSRFERGETIDEMAATYVESAEQRPHEYQLFYSHAHLLTPPRGRGRPKPIRVSRPNFAFTERLLARQLGGKPEDHTQLALMLWALLHGTTMLLVCKSIPAGHEDELRAACRVAVRSLVGEAAHKKVR